MSHYGIISSEPAKDYFLKPVPYRVLDQTEIEKRENEIKIERLRIQRRLTNLREEYRHLKDFKVQLVHPQSHDVNLSYTLEELFEMFTLTQDWRDAVL